MAGVKLNNANCKRRKFLSAKLQASSLMEVVVALVIIMTVFGLGMMIYMNVLRSSFAFRNLQASLLLDETAKECREKKLFLDEVSETETMVIQKTVSKYQGMENLILLELVVTDKENKVLAERKELILKE